MEKENCIVCGPQPRSHFGKDPRCKNGLKRKCKDCEKEYQSTLSKTPKYRAKKKRWREDNQDWLFEYREGVKMEGLIHYSGNPPKCMCSGCEVTDPKFLTFDHINGGGRKHREEVKVELRFWLRANDYPDGFQVLCFNCNCAKGKGERCPNHGKSPHFTCP